MEDALLDLAACVRDARERLGYEKIVLVGWRGGGSLLAGNHAGAERKTITRTAAGEVSVVAETEFLPEDGITFVVQGTMADLRWLDPSVDPKDRKPNWSYLGDLPVANGSPSGLARFSTTRGWLPQWSIEHAQVDAVDSARITVPALVVVNSADDACPPEHQTQFFAALGCADERITRSRAPTTTSVVASNGRISTGRLTTSSPGPRTRNSSTPDLHRSRPAL